MFWNIPPSVHLYYYTTPDPDLESIVSYLIMCIKHVVEWNLSNKAQYYTVNLSAKLPNTPNQWIILFHESKLSSIPLTLLL